MKNQTIGCQVTSCAYHQDGTHTCGLESIQVSACNHGSGNSAEDTKCASFRCKNC